MGLTENERKALEILAGCEDGMMVQDDLYSELYDYLDGYDDFWQLCDGLEERGYTIDTFDENDFPAILITDEGRAAL